MNKPALNLRSTSQGTQNPSKSTPRAVSSTQQSLPDNICPAHSVPHSHRPPNPYYPHYQLLIWRTYIQPKDISSGGEPGKQTTTEHCLSLPISQAYAKALASGANITFRSSLNTSLSDDIKDKIQLPLTHASDGTPFPPQYIQIADEQLRRIITEVVGFQIKGYGRWCFEGMQRRIVSPLTLADKGSEANGRGEYLESIAVIVCLGKTKKGMNGLPGYDDQGQLLELMLEEGVVAVQGDGGEDEECLCSANREEVNQGKTEPRISKKGKKTYPTTNHHQRLNHHFEFIPLSPEPDSTVTSSYEDEDAGAEISFVAAAEAQLQSSFDSYQAGSGDAGVKSATASRSGQPEEHGGRDASATTHTTSYGAATTLDDSLTVEDDFNASFVRPSTPTPSRMGNIAKGIYGGERVVEEYPRLSFSHIPVLRPPQMVKAYGHGQTPGLMIRNVAAEEAAVRTEGWSGRAFTYPYIASGRSISEQDLITPIGSPGGARVSTPGTKVTQSGMVSAARTTSLSHTYSVPSGVSSFVSVRESPLRALAGGTFSKPAFGGNTPFPPGQTIRVVEPTPPAPDRLAQTLPPPVPPPLFPTLAKKPSRLTKHMEGYNSPSGERISKVATTTTAARQLRSNFAQPTAAFASRTGNLKGQQSLSSAREPGRVLSRPISPAKQDHKQLRSPFKFSASSRPASPVRRVRAPLAPSPVKRGRSLVRKTAHQAIAGRQGRHTTEHMSGEMDAGKEANDSKAAKPIVSLRREGKDEVQRAAGPFRKF